MLPINRPFRNNYCVIIFVVFRPSKSENLSLEENIHLVCLLDLIADFDLTTTGFAGVRIKYLL